MNIFKRIFGGETRSEEVTPSIDDLLLRALVGTGEITEQQALEIPAFSAAVDFIAQTVAMLPIKLYRENKTEHTTEEITDDNRLFLLNDETGDLLGAYEAKQAQIKDMLCGGAGYIYIKRNGNRIKSLHYVNRAAVSVNKGTDPINKDADILIYGKRYLPFDFIIITRATSDGVTGRGIVQEHNLLLSIMYNSFKFENAITKTGGNKKGFLQSEKRLAKPAIDELKQAWREMYSNNDSNMIVLNDGVKFEQSSNTSVEMQLNQNKITNSQQIAMIFSLSPDVISGKATRDVYMSSIRTAVLNVVDRYQAALNRSLLLEAEKQDMYFTLDTTELLRGDTLSRYQAYQVGLQNSFLQVDEVRYKEDMQPLGINYIKLGLNDVLYDPDKNEIYTPNTNRFVKLGEQIVKNDLKNDGDSGIILDNESRYSDSQPRGSNGKWCGGGGNGSSANKSTIEMVKSVSAKAVTDRVLLPDGSRGRIKENTSITKVVAFAGRGTNKPVKIAEYLANKYKNDKNDWIKLRGDGYVECPDGKTRHAELHWFESQSTGRVKMKVKRWFNEG